MIYSNSVKEVDATYKINSKMLKETIDVLKNKSMNTVTKRTDTKEVENRKDKYKFIEELRLMKRHGWEKQ